VVDVLAPDCAVVATNLGGSDDTVEHVDANAGFARRSLCPLGHRVAVGGIAADLGMDCAGVAGGSRQVPMGSR
jgi:hypothetical protein